MYRHLRLCLELKGVCSGPHKFPVLLECRLCRIGTWDPMGKDLLGKMLYHDRLSGSIEVARINSLKSSALRVECQAIVRDSFGKNGPSSTHFGILDRETAHLNSEVGNAPSWYMAVLRCPFSTLILCWHIGRNP